MKKKFICLIALFNIVTIAKASDDVAKILDNTDWRGSDCTSYGDGIFQGTYNFNFKENKQVESYLEYYDDYSCTKSSGKTDPQVIGSYVVKSIKKDGNLFLIKLSVKMTHLRENVIFNIKLNDNKMQLCWDNRWCSNLVKR